MPEDRNQTDWIVEQLQGVGIKTPHESVDLDWATELRSEYLIDEQGCEFGIGAVRGPYGDWEDAIGLILVADVKLDGEDFRIAAFPIGQWADREQAFLEGLRAMARQRFTREMSTGKRVPGLRLRKEIKLETETGLGSSLAGDLTSDKGGVLDPVVVSGKWAARPKSDNPSVALTSPEGTLHVMGADEVATRLNANESLRKQLLAAREEISRIGGLVALAQERERDAQHRAQRYMEAAYHERDKDADATRIRELQVEIREQHQLIARQADLLTRTAAALKGDPPALVMWSHHDLPEIAERMVAERNEVQKLEKIRQVLEDEL